MAKQADVNEQLRNAVRGGNEDTVRLLLKERGNPDCSTCKYSDNSTLLMVASHRGYKSIVQLLVKSGENVNETDNDGGTALHWAAMEDHHEIALYLIKMEANVNAVTKIGWTPLHVAAIYGHDGTVQVLMEQKANPNIPNMDGETPLHFAAEFNKPAVIDVLLRNKADADCRNKNGDTPLHLAALRNNGATVNVLLTNKANADAENKRGQKPYDLARDKQLKKVLQFAVLYAEGTVPPKVMKLCVIGAAGAGKTTFLKALKRGFFAWLINRENQVDDPTCEYERTVGINVRTINIPGVGTFALFDHAGQKQFHKTHGLFFKALNSFFILLLSLVKGDQRLARSFEELIAEAQYWLSFLRASLENEFIPTVMIAVSRADCCPDGHGLLQRVVKHMQDLFQGKVNITEESFLLDCRKSHSSEMMKLRVFLKQTREQFLKQSSIRYPRLCEPVTSRLLPALRHKEKEPFMETERLVKAIEEGEGKGQKQNVLDKVVEFLDETGEVIKVGDVVSLNPCWLSQYALGPIIAAEDMKWHAKAPAGRMTREEAERAINQYLRDHNIKVTVKVDTVLKLLLDLGLAFILEDGTYMIPARLPPLQHVSEVWKREEEKKVYVGRRQLCSSPTSIFSPAAFSLFQCQACIQIDKLARLWRDGIIAARAESVESHVQCLVTMVDPLRAVDFIARGRVGSESHCLSLLDDVTKVWAHTVEEHSPGTDYEMGYLSRKHLCEHREDIAVYLQSEVNEVIARGPTAAVRKVIGSEDLVENLQDLMVLPQSPQKSEPVGKAISRHGHPDVESIITAIIRVGSDQWYGIGLKLGLNHAQINDTTHAMPTNPDKLRALIETRRLQVDDQTVVRELLDACVNIAAPIFGVVEEELKRQGVWQ